MRDITHKKRENLRKHGKKTCYESMPPPYKSFIYGAPGCYDAFGTFAVLAMR